MLRKKVYLILLKESYYLLIQMDEEDKDTREIIRKIKRRTEIVEKTEFPIFEKNIFLFERLNFSFFPFQNETMNSNSEKIINYNYIIRIGLFKTNLNNCNLINNLEEENKTLNENSLLIGNANLKIENKLIEDLKINSNVEMNINIMSIDELNLEIGKIYFKLRINLKDKKMTEKLDLDIIKNLLYDPLETNKSLINRVKLIKDILKSK